MATVVVAFTDFLINFAMLMVLMAWFGFWPGWRLSLLPLFILMAFMASTGPVCGSPRSMSNTVISVMSFRLWCRSAFMSHPSGSALTQLEQLPGVAIQ